MIVVIIAGGSGTRLWPLSTPEYPKHLLKINDDKKSLLQNTYERAKHLSNKIYISSEAGHVEHVQQQLPEVTKENFIIEPARRGTASCILLALAEIAKHNSKDEPIAFLSSDHYVRDTHGFAHSFKVAAETSKSHKRIVLVGIEPTYPATGFGYIKKGSVLNEQEFVFNVACFKEKPDFETARQYVKSGNYLWNGGYFVGSISTFSSVMQTSAPDLYKSYQALTKTSGPELSEIYMGLENISIDYALIEKVKNLLAVPASFDWMDLGTFEDMYKAVERDELGNHCYGAAELDDVRNSLVLNHEDKPVAVIGLDNVVVINTPEGILVANRDLSQKVGEVSKKLNRG